jgi:hypothetical protein
VTQLLVTVLSQLEERANEENAERPSDAPQRSSLKIPTVTG